MYHFEYYGYTKAQLEKRGIYGAFEENNYLKVVPDMMDSYKIYKRSRGLRFICSCISGKTEKILAKKTTKWSE